MSRTKVDCVEEAVRLAEELKLSGRRYWFRGQAQGWPVISSLVRLDAEKREIAFEKLARFELWVNKTEGLESIAVNTDSVLAVAQHYGLPTNFVDFTTQPQIAGFFASEKADSETTEDLACIICLDVENLKEFWLNHLSKYAPLEFLELTVPDLWRLEAQHGRFLYCPYDNIERLYDFDRIFFPNISPLPCVSRKEIYPERKSHLEVLLDQYLMNERMIESWREHTPANVVRIVVNEPTGGCDPDVYQNGLPGHSSWLDGALRPWLELPSETLDQARTAVSYRILVPDLRDPFHIVNEVSMQLRRDLMAFEGIRNKLVNWKLESKSGNDLPENFEARLIPRLERLWDGMRLLPYSDEDLSLGIGQCIAFAVALGGDFQNSDGRHWERAAQHCLTDPIYLEFGAKDGSHSRGYASAAGLAAAIRPDFLSFVSDPWIDQLDRSVYAVLQTAWTPMNVFDCDRLASIFAREIAPYQVLERNLAVFYSPARLVKLGLP